MICLRTHVLLGWHVYQQIIGDLCSAICANLGATPFHEPTASEQRCGGARRRFLIGILYRCLVHHTAYDEPIAALLR